MGRTSYNIFIFVVFCLSLSKFINNQGTYVPLKYFYNTQIASAANCPKCLDVNSTNSSIGFNDCVARDNNDSIYKSQRFIILLNEGYKYLIYQKFSKSSMPFTSNLLLSSAIKNSIEMMPIEDDGGHYIQLLDTNSCLYHDYNLSNQSTNDYSSLFHACDYKNANQKKYFKFYFFKTDYTFPDFKVNIRIYKYNITNEARYQLSFTDAILENSVIYFTEQTTGEVRSIEIYYTKLLIPQLPIGNWDINLIVLNTDWYYKTDPYYYFPITKCNENLEYGADILLRYKQVAQYIGGTSGSNVLYSIKAKRDIIIKSMTGTLTKYTCSQYQSSNNDKVNWASNAVSSTNKKIKANDCFLAFASNNSVGGMSEVETYDYVKGYLRSSGSYSDSAISVSGGCLLHGAAIGQYSCGFMNMYYCFGCYSRVKFYIVYFDDEEGSL